MHVRFDLKAGSIFTRFLDGSRFDDNLRILYDEHPSKVPDRIETLEKLASGKNVLHIGFCDHLPVVAAKIAHNRWLHSRLRAVARRCVGVDIDESAVERIVIEHGIDDVFAGDITNGEPLPAVISEHWDIIIIGEVLEHIGNPVHFLTRIKEVYGSNIDRVVITVPNAFRAGNFLGVFRGVETINSDHRFFFTPYTLAKIVHDSGMKPDKLTMAKFSEGAGLRGWMKSNVLRLFPLLSENIIFEAQM